MTSQRMAVALSFIAVVLTFFPTYGYTRQTPIIMAELSVGYTKMGWLASITTATAGLLVMLVAALVDCFGAKLVVLTGTMFLIFGQVVFGLGSNYPVLLIARVLIGVGVASLIVAPYTLVIQWYGTSNRIATAMGVMLATDGVGSAVGIYALPTALSRFTWKQQQMISAGLLLGILFVFAIFLREPPHVHTPSRRINIARIGAEYRATVRYANVISSALFLAGIGAGFSAVAVWVPTILVERASWSNEIAGMVGALYSLIGVITAVIFGVISDRIGRRKVFVVVSGVGVATCFGVDGMLLQMEFYKSFVLVLAIAGLFTYVGLPLSYVLAADEVGSDFVSYANGIALGAGLLCGSTFSPLVISIIKDMAGSYTMGFLVISLAQYVFCVTGPVIFGREIRRPRVLGY